MNSMLKTSLRRGAQTLVLTGAMMMFAPVASAGVPWWYYGIEYSETTTTTGNSVTVSGSWGILCGATANAVANPDEVHSVVTGVHVGNDWPAGDLVLTGPGGAMPMAYDKELSNSYNDLWGSDMGTWQFYKSEPMFPPANETPVDFELTARFGGIPLSDQLEGLQVYITNDAPDLYDRTVAPAMATAYLDTSPYANVDVRLSGGTDNSVTHGCSTTGPYGGSMAIFALLAVAMRRRRDV